MIDLALSVILAAVIMAGGAEWPDAALLLAAFAVLALFRRSYLNNPDTKERPLYRVVDAAGFVAVMMITLKAFS